MLILVLFIKTLDMNNMLWYVYHFTARWSLCVPPV